MWLSVRKSFVLSYFCVCGGSGGFEHLCGLFKALADPLNGVLQHETISLTKQGSSEGGPKVLSPPSLRKSAKHQNTSATTATNPNLLV